MANYIERPRHRASINKTLQRENCTLEKILTENISEKKKTQIKKMIWERDYCKGKIMYKKTQKHMEVKK